MDVSNLGQLEDNFWLELANKKVIHNRKVPLHILSTDLVTEKKANLFMKTQVIPWMSPSLSQSMRFVLSGIGHQQHFSRGEIIYSSPDFFDALMYVKSGFVVKTLLDPVRDEPLLLSLVGAGALCGSYENLYVHDRMPRRHWCLTSTTVLVVNQELLMKIADENPEWQQELMNYTSAAALCDRMGMYLNYSGTVEERLGALLLLMLQGEDPSSSRSLFSSGIDWIELRFFPGRKTMAQILGCKYEMMNEVIRTWVIRGDIRRRGGKIWIRRKTFLRYWEWLLPIMREKKV